MANKVELYNNGTLIGTDNAPVVSGGNWSYSIPYTADSGNNVLTAKAFVDNVEVASSGVRNVVVNAAGGSFDPDFQAVLDVATANSIAHPDEAEKAVLNQWIIDRKATGKYQKEDVIFKADGSAPTAFKLICLKRKIVMENAGGLVFDSGGVTGETGKAIKTKYTPSTDAVNVTATDVAISMVYVSGSAINWHLAGVRSVSSKFLDLSFGTTGMAVGRLATTAQGLSTTKFENVGVEATITKVNGTYTFDNGVATPEEIVVTPAGVGLPENELFLMAAHRADSGVGTIATPYLGKVALITVGGSKL